MSHHSQEFEKDVHILEATKVVGWMIRHCQSPDQSQIKQKINK